MMNGHGIPQLHALTVSNVRFGFEMHMGELVICVRHALVNATFFTCMLVFGLDHLLVKSTTIMLSWWEH